MEAVTSPDAPWQPPLALRTVADQLPLLVWIAAEDGARFWYNRKCREMTGRSQVDLVTRGWWESVHPDARSRVLAAWQAAITKGGSYECVYPLLGRDGQYRHFIARAEPQRGGDGAITHWFGTSTDITEQVLAERFNRYLVNLDEALRTAPTPADARGRVVQLLGQELEADRVHFSEPDFDRHETRVTEEFLAAGVASIAGVHRFADAVFDLYMRGEPVVLRDYREHLVFAEDRQRSEIADLPFCAILDVPLIRQGRLVTVLSVHQTVPRTWSAEEVRLAVATAERCWDLIERLRAEDQLRRSAEEIEAIYASAPIGLAVLDRDLRYVRINERLAEINGFVAADHIGKSVRELLPDLAPRVEPALARVLEGNEVWGIEVAGETPAQPGIVRTWRENWLPVRGIDGEIVGVAISAEEVTDQKAAQIALARSEAQFRTLAEAVPGMLFIAAADGGNSYVNEAYARFSGLSKEELYDLGWSHLLHPDDQPRAWAAWRQAVETGSPYEIDYRMRRHDGCYRWIAARALRIPDPDGHQLWVGTCTDVHDARVAQQEIAAAEARYRAIFEQAGVGVARVSPDGPFLEINDRFCQILRRDREDLLGHGWKHITHPDDVAEDLSRVEAMLRGELDGYSLEKRYVAPDGSDIWVNLTVGAQRDEDGRVLFFIPVVEDIGARKAAEAALRAKEERYRALFESMEQGFCTIQVSFGDDGQPTDYRFTELNPAFTRHTGLPQDVLDRSVREAVPDLEQSWFDRYGEVVRTGTAIRFVDHAEPLGRWFEVYAFPIGDPAQHNVAVLFSDVTERVEREQRLRTSEQDLRLRLNAIPQMVWSTLPDGYHDFYNERWYEFTGVPAGSTDGEAWNNMFHPEDQPLAWERWSHSLTTGEPYEIEYRLRHHSGDYRWVLGRALPIRDGAGDIVRWMGTCTDINDRIEAERQQKATEARLRAVIEAAPVGLVFADPSGRITGGNARVEELLGHSLTGTAGPSDSVEWTSFHADGSRVAREESPLSRVIAENRDRVELDVHYQRGNGRRSWIRFSAAPIRDDRGAINGAVVASIDIDREKRLTETLEREVEKVVAEREAAQEALRQSQKLEAMGQLTGGVAHDFNNLLTPIIGSLDLLQRKQILDERTGRLVDGALASAEKARVLVQRLLAFARRQPLKPQAVDLARVIGEMSELVDSTSGPRIRVVTDVPSDLPPALADGNQLEMALLNLSVNARDAMPDGGTLTIAARNASEDAGKHLGLARRPHIVLAVTDTGVGMDEATRARAIEPFFSTKGLGKGTGLGLSMVHGLAAQLGGALDIRSAPGMGTTIELWLPLARSSVSEGAPAIGEVESHGAGTVLLVDDEELVRESTAGMLADLGYRVAEADCGEAALALVDEGLRPNLLVTDQLMPGLSGTDLAVRLRERFAGLPVLVVSGYADLESLSPAFPHLSKPFRQAELSAALEKIAV
nr:PAS domain S-box protein [uncultured Sphingomonas sp.]